MPTLVEVSLRFLREAALFLQGSGRAAQSLLLNALSASSPEASERMKSGGRGAPPYSVGRVTLPRELVGRGTGPGGYLRVPAGTAGRFFVGLADDSLVDPVLSALDGTFEMGSAEVEVGARVRRSEGYGDLLASQPARTVSIRTRNPLILGAVSPGDYPDSVPPRERAPFGRWDPWRDPLNPAHLLILPFRAWNAYAPPELAMPGSAIGVLGRLEVELVDLTWRSARIPVGGRLRPEVGYTGTVILSAGGLDSFSGALVAALARLAEYTGLGSRTTEGFGSVSVRLSPRPAGRLGRRRGG